MQYRSGRKGQGEGDRSSVLPACITAGIIYYVRGKMTFLLKVTQMVTDTNTGPSGNTPGPARGVETQDFSKQPLPQHSAIVC